MSEGQEIPQPRWENTIRGIERIRRAHPQIFEEPSAEAPHGLLAGRQIIGRDTMINGGVYLGSGAREAIVVDDKQYPKELQQVYQQLITSLDQGKGSRKSIFDYVYEISKARLGGNRNSTDVERMVDQLVAQITKLRGLDATVPLNFFIQKGVGVCRHRALLAGYLVERLIQAGKLNGKVSIDRNAIPGQGGHAWARYESLDRKTIVVIDPSLDYVGSIKKAPKVWFYERPSDQRFTHF